MIIKTNKLKFIIEFVQGRKWLDMWLAYILFLAHAVYIQAISACDDEITKNLDKGFATFLNISGLKFKDQIHQHNQTQTTG